jgi:hypothetical protein
MTQTPEQILTKIRDQSKARSQRYYEANKDKIAERRKAKRQECKDCLEENNKVVLPTKKEKVQAETLKQVVDYLKSENIQSIYINNTKQLADILDIINFQTAFKPFKNVIYKIETATLKNDSSKLYSINSKKSLYQTILKLKDLLDIPMTKPSLQAYKDKFEEYKIESSDQSKQKSQDEEVADFDEYLKDVKTEYGEVSMPYIIASLYNLSGFRDDLQLKIIEKETKQTDKENKINYIIVPLSDKVNCTIILNKYKTAAKYERNDIIIPKPLSKLIRKYMKNEDLDYNDYLFGNKSLVKDIIKFNKKIGYDITINTLRKMKVSGSDLTTPKKRVEVAKQMHHSTKTTENYKHKKGQVKGKK